MSTQFSKMDVEQRNKCASKGLLIFNCGMLIKKQTFDSDVSKQWEGNSGRIEKYRRSSKITGGIRNVIKAAKVRKKKRENNKVE